MLHRLLHLLLCLALLSAPLGGVAGLPPLAAVQGGERVVALLDDAAGAVQAAPRAVHKAAADRGCGADCRMAGHVGGGGADCCNTGSCAFCGHCVSAVLPALVQLPLTPPDFPPFVIASGLVTRAIAPPHRPPLALLG